MSRIFRRCLSSLPEGSAANPLEASKSSTLPHAVRERRAALPNAPSIGRTMTPAQEKKYQHWLLENNLPENGESRARWLDNHDEWRSRVRGHTLVRQNEASPKAQLRDLRQLNAARREEAGDAPTLTSPTPLQVFKSTLDNPSTQALAAERVYLPNIQIRLMRNHTPPGQAYDPYTATFRIPPSMTKTDLRSYLDAVYGLKVTFIRTDNYYGDIVRLGTAGQLKRKSGSTKTYKRAVVGLREPFHYPDDLAELDAVIAASEDPAAQASMSEEERQELILRAEGAKAGQEKRKEWMNSNFMMNYQHDGRKKSLFKMAKGWRWRSATHDNKGNIVREIMSRRAERESTILAAVKELREKGMDREADAYTA